MTLNPYPVDPTGPLTLGYIPDADLDALVAATIPVPPGFTPDTASWDGTSRVLWATPRGITGRTDISVVGVAHQRGDGTITDQPEPPGIYVEAVEPLTIAQARQFAAELLAVADQLDALTGGAR